MKCIFVCICLVFSSGAISSQPGDFDHMGGYIFSVSHVKYEEFNYDGGISYNANFVGFFPSVGFEYIDSDFDITNLFLGIGFSNLIQLQVGTGSEGRITRVRSDLFVFSLFDSSKNEFPLMFPNRKSAKWFDRIAMSVSLTEYEEVNLGRQMQLGFGFTF